MPDSETLNFMSLACNGCVIQPDKVTQLHRHPLSQSPPTPYCPPQPDPPSCIVHVLVCVYQQPDPPSCIVHVLVCVYQQPDPPSCIVHVLVCVYQQPDPPSCIVHVLVCVYQQPDPPSCIVHVLVCVYQVILPGKMTQLVRASDYRC